jgi:dienelactone hydrolase
MRRLFLFLSLALSFSPGARAANELKFDSVQLKDSNAPITLEIAYRPGVVSKYSAILMLGTLHPKDGNWELPNWSTNLVNEGFLLAAFRAERAPDPDPARRPQWLYFDERFAHSYVAGGANAVLDAGRVMDYLQSRGDVQKFGWVGSSSTGIPGLAVATREPRLNAIVAFVSTGAYRQWLESWQANDLWRGKTKSLWPETETLLPKVDPILFVEKMFPCAVLMVSGGNDKVVDPKTARAFVDAARPFYANDPDRLRLVVYEGFGHNLPTDIVPMHVENWFRLYLHPTRPPPKSLDAASDIHEAAKRSSVTGIDHKKVMEAK